MPGHENIICFKHCGTISVFCKRVPKRCPVCNEALTSWITEPFVLPHPLVNGKDCYCAILVRPSVGNFLDNYDINDDLHIGITNSCGNVIEYDKCGLVRNDNVKWQSCIAVTLIPKSWEIFWDETLEALGKDSQWDSNCYNDQTFNCFNFVIEFLKMLNYKDMRNVNKEHLCEAFILPKIKNVVKYASIYRELREKEFYIQE